jgi:RND superfamily putative drug exporter
VSPSPERPVRRRDWTILAVTLVIVALAAPFAMRASHHLTAGGFSVPGSQSAKVESALAKDYPQLGPTDLAVLVWPRRHASAAAAAHAIARVRRVIRGVTGVTLSAEAVQLGLLTSELSGPAVLPLRLTVSHNEAENVAQIVRQRLLRTSFASDDAEVHLLGEDAVWAALTEASRQDLVKGEAISAPVLLIVLLMTFGSLTAATLPMLLGATAVVIAGALIYWLSFVTQLSIFTTDTASMLGLGVAVDYSLLILTRVRQELQAGRSFNEARAIAVATSGRTVLFSGITVIAALVGIFVIPNEALRSIALGAVLVVAISAVVSVTLLPALMSVVGAQRLHTNVHATRVVRRIHRGRLLRLNWEQWARVVMQHPVRAILASAGVMLLLSAPAVAIRTSTGALQQLPARSEARVGINEAAKLDGPGRLGPIDVVANDSRATPASEFYHYVGELRRVSDRSRSVERVGAFSVASSGSTALFVVFPSVAPESSAADRLVKHLRNAFARVRERSGFSAAVGGASASIVDEEQQITGHMVELIVMVLALAFLVLMLALRSIVVPLKALIMNILSIGATYGVLVLVFQWGWLDGALHFHSVGHVDSLVPPLALSVVFGLSMDYEIFLLSRIRERWRASGDSRTAVAEGLAASARTISSAAFVLACVLGVFAVTGLPFIREIGLGASAAIGLDVTLLRLTLVPATMRILGDWNWWWPKAFERFLPSHPRGHVPTSEATETPP